MNIQQLRIYYYKDASIYDHNMRRDLDFSNCLLKYFLKILIERFLISEFVIFFG